MVALSTKMLYFATFCRKTEVTSTVPYNKIGNLSTHIKHPQKCNPPQSVHM